MFNALVLLIHRTVNIAESEHLEEELGRPGLKMAMTTRRWIKLWLDNRKGWHEWRKRKTPSEAQPWCHFVAL